MYNAVAQIIISSLVIYFWAWLYPASFFLFCSLFGFLHYAYVFIQNLTAFKSAQPCKISIKIWNLLIADNVNQFSLTHGNIEIIVKFE